MDTAFTIEVVDGSWELFDKILRLDYEVLYRDCGVPFDADWFHEDEGSAFAVALSRGRLLGSARLLGNEGDAQRQLRQVVVEPAVRRMGVGGALVGALEKVAEVGGTQEVWLNARENAYAFYAQLGYSFDSETFISELTQLPHRVMRKKLSVSAEGL